MFPAQMYAAYGLLAGLIMRISPLSSQSCCWGAVAILELKQKVDFRCL